MRYSVHHENEICCRHKITLSLSLSLPIKSRDGVVCKVFSELRTIDAFRTDSIIADWGCAKSYYKVIVEKLLTIQAPIQNRRAKRAISASLLWNFVSSISGSWSSSLFPHKFPRFSQGMLKYHIVKLSPRILLQISSAHMQTAHLCLAPILILWQCSRRFLGIIGWDLRVCKSNRLHVDILRFLYINLRYIP